MKSLEVEQKYHKVNVGLILDYICCVNNLGFAQISIFLFWWVKNQDGQQKNSLVRFIFLC